MGPYCKFCDRRCFVPFPNETPGEALDAYVAGFPAHGIDIIGTCARGQALEREKTGWCYDRIQEVIAADRVFKEASAQFDQVEK